MSNPIVRIEVQKNDGQAKQFPYCLNVNGGMYGQLFTTLDEAVFHAEGLTSALVESGCDVVSSTLNIDKIRMKPLTSKEKQKVRLNNSAESLLKAALEAHKLLQGVVPSGNYGGTSSQKYKKQLERINRVFSMLDNAIADGQGLP